MEKSSTAPVSRMVLYLMVNSNMAKRLKLKTCDIFWIPLYNGKFCFGQIFGPISNGNFAIIVFDHLRDDMMYDPTTIMDSRIILLGHTMDALFSHKRWGVVDNIPRTFEFLELPIFKVGDTDNLRIIDFWGNFIRKGLPEEDAKYSYRFSRSPIGYQNAMDVY